MTPKYRILHIGDNIKYNHDVYQRFASEFEIIQPSTKERQRDEFIRGLKERQWGDFDAIFRPFWSTGGEMGRWDRELIPLLPASVKIMASAGAGFDWADVDVFAEHGMFLDPFPWASAAATLRWLTMYGGTQALSTATVPPLHLNPLQTWPSS